MIGPDFTQVEESEMYAERENEFDFAKNDLEDEQDEAVAVSMTLGQATRKCRRLRLTMEARSALLP